MKRTIDYPVSITDSTLRVEQFLRRNGYSKQNLTTLKHSPESVLVNGKPYRLNEPLAPGDLLTVTLSEQTSSPHILPVKLPLSILYEDEDLLIVNKPAGLPIHPSKENLTYSLANGLAWYYQEQKIPFVFRCCNRLDQDTSGLTIVAKHMVSSSILASMTKTRALSREYLAIVEGHVTPSSGIISAPLTREDGPIIKQRVDFEHGKPAITHYKLIETSYSHSLVALKLETGRTHQIRVHMKHLGYPLLGDYLYNSNMKHISRQALHSHRLTFSHPITGVSMQFTAPLPEDMQQTLSNLKFH